MGGLDAMGGMGSGRDELTTPWIGGSADFASFERTGGAPATFLRACGTAGGRAFEVPQLAHPPPQLPRVCSFLSLIFPSCVRFAGHRYWVVLLVLVVRHDVGWGGKKPPAVLHRWQRQPHIPTTREEADGGFASRFETPSMKTYPKSQREVG